MIRTSEAKKTPRFQSPTYQQDRCWLVPGVAASVIFLTSTITSSRGYLYVLYMDHYKVDRETASWVDSTFLLTGSLIGFGLTVLQAKVSLYCLTMQLSVATICAGVVGGAFCPNMLCTTVTIGGLYGAGFGASMTCFGLYTMLYFDKYKATATGVKYASLAASGIAAPTIMSLIVNRYGLQGALLLCGAIAMQALPMVMLIKQPRPFKICCRQVGTVHDSNGSGENKELRSIYAVEIPQLTQMPSPLRASSPYQTRPPVDMVGISAKSVARMIVIPEFYALIIVYFAVDWTGIIHTTTVVDYGRDKGVPLESANYLQTCAAVGELVGRTVVPFLSDKTPFGHCMFAAAGVVGTSLMLFGMSFHQPFACFATLNALHGVFQGYVYCIRPVLITDYLGLERLPVFFGFLGVILMPVSLANPAILGFFRDTLGSYDNFYRVFGAVNIAISVPLFIITFRDRARGRNWNINQQC